MKVLHIIDTLGLGGAQTVVKGIFEKRKNSKNIFLYVLRKKDIKTKINHKNVKMFNSNKKYSLAPIKELRELIEKEKIDVLHCHLFKAQFFGYLLKKRYFPKIKLIIHEHGQIFQNDFYYNKFMNIAQNKTDLFIAVSKATRQKLIQKAKINPKKIKILYNFVDLNKFNRKSITININKEKDKLRIKKDEFVIGFVGRLAKVKGCEYLIKALPHLNFKYKVLIVGEGPEREKLAKLAKKLEMGNKIIFLGYRNDLINIYPIFDVLVVPSLNESFGLNVLEAQVLGVPVIGSNIEGLKELILDKRSLFNKRDSKNLALKINKKIMYLGDVNQYCLDGYNEKLNNFYKFL